MKFHIENFGPIKKADVQLGDLTIVCGPNNSGKTYVTYAICIFLHFIWNKMALEVENNLVNELLDKGAINVKLSDFIPLYIKAAKDTVAQWKKYLPDYMAMHPERCTEAAFSVEITQKELETKLAVFKNAKINMTFQMTNSCELRLAKDAKSIHAQLMLVNQNDSMPAFDLVKTMLGICLAKVFVNPANFHIADQGPFMITCERTGAALFRDQLLISQKIANETQKNMTQYSEEAKTLDFHGYQYPVAKELEYVTRLNEIVSKESVLMKHNPEIFTFFTQMVGGRYEYDTFTRQIFFYPAENPKLSLRLSEASSTVKSLLKLNFYLRHQACAGQMLIFDEPELDLHPSNQRSMARLLAMMAQAGIDVFITTHSDYLIKEFNTLVMLNYSEDSRVSELRDKYGYSQKELLNSDFMRVYYATQGQLKGVSVSPDVGMAIPSFDENIRQMGKMQRDILYGGRKNENA